MKSRKDLKINDIENIFSSWKPGVEGEFKFFSVLVPLVEKGGVPHLLYEVRAKHMVRQPGEICFPGGKLEAEESSKMCALRETWEEVGIAPESIRIINRLDTIYTYSNFAMYSYLGIMNEEVLQNIKLSPDEVDEVFLVPLEDLVNQEPKIYKTEIVPMVPEDFPYDKVTGGREYNWRKGSSRVPIYEVNGRIIWGLTARITKCVMDVIKDQCRDL